MSTPTSPIDDFESLGQQLQHDPERPLTSMQRRRFLQGALALGGAAIAVPTALADQAAAQTGNDAIVVTVTLAGGNDGLNSLGPFSNSNYRALRGPLSIDPNSGHTADDGLSFHPNLRRLATRYRRGDVAVVSGVGEPSRDRSHFSNMARWQSANPEGRITATGWVGRWLDSEATSQFSGIGIGGNGVPLHFRGASSDVTDIPARSNALYGSDRSDARDQRMYRAIRQMGKESNRGPWVNAVGAVGAQAVDSAQEIAPAFKDELPENQLTADMVSAARLINLNLGTRALNILQGGYDTHDNQIGANSGVGIHAELLEELDASLDVFFATLSPVMAERVVVMVYSEFGRRAAANSSRGTDHGTSNHVFIIGRRVNGGLYGDRPPLNRLDDRGDFLVTRDFRDVYASVIEQAFGTSAAGALGQGYNTLDLIGGRVPVESNLSIRAREIRDRRKENFEDYLLLNAPTF